MKYPLTLFLTFFLSSKVFAQGCTVQGALTEDTIICGQSATLSVFGQGQGVALLSENFNSGSFGPGWTSSPQASWNNPCSSGGVDGTTHIWLGNQSPVPRVLTTASFNLSSCATAGVTICFDLLMAEQGGTSPCEGPDEPDEGIYLQYSTTNGTTWTDIHYFDPNGGNDPIFINWNNWCFPVPAAALTANTRFRLFQDNDSGADYDHWGVDNVTIYCNDPTFNIIWVHDGYNQGPTGGVNPTPVSPQTTTSYPVIMSNGTITCRDTVTLFVKQPTLQVNAGADTTICAGQCATLNGSTKVVVSPAKVVTYSNNETTQITTGLGQVTNIGINVTGLNMTNVLPNSITQICLENVFFFGQNIFPPSLVTIANLILSVTCPSGQTIILVPANVTTGGSNPLSGGYNSTCWVPAGGANIAGGAAPYSGSYAPNQPFNNLAGCTANGVWEFNVQMNSALGFGTGTFSGWNITFDDPEISYTSLYNWTPTTNMTNSTTLNPTVCPPSTATYTLTARDSANCVTNSDAVTVTVQPTCCSFTFAPTAVAPSCGLSTGSVTMGVNNGSGNYNYLWSNGSTTNTATGLGAGQVSVTITDNGQGCTKDTIITLNSNSSLTVNLTRTNPTCAGNDGTITGTFSGGTGPFSIVIDTNGTTQTINTPFLPPSQTLGGIGAGIATITVTDAQSCVATANVNLTTPTNCCTFGVSAVLTQPGCAVSNGSIALTASNGSNNYTYAWGNSANTATISNLSAGTYSVTITDNGFANCFIDTSFTLSSNSTLSVSLTSTNPTCAGNDGNITGTFSGGTSPYAIVIDTNGTQQTLNTPILPPSQTLGGIGAGTATITVTDGQGCVSTASATLTAPTNCCTFTTSATFVQPTCGLSDGEIALTSTNGSGNYVYAWSSGVTTATVSNLAAGSYSVTITDNGFANCFIDTVFSLNSNSSLAVSLVGTDPTCAGNDGTITGTFAGGTSPFTIVIDTNGTSQTINTPILPPSQTLGGIGVGTATITVTDAQNCVATDNVTLSPASNCCAIQTTAVVTNGSCGANNASISVAIDNAGNPPYTFAINGGTPQNNNVFTGLAAGNYTIIVFSQGGCNDTIQATVAPSNNNLTLTITPIDISCFGANDGSISTTPNGGSAPIGFVWSTGGTNPTISNLASGNYTVTATDANGCSGSAAALINEPTALSINLGADTSLCEGQTTTISAPAGFATYTWSNGATLSGIIPLVTDTYIVTVTDANGCTASAAINVTFVPVPTIELGLDILTYEGLSVGLNPIITPTPQNGTFSWLPADFLSCSACQNTVVNAVDTVTYTFTYTNEIGCSANSSITVNVLPVGELFFPNAFTPNGDGNNETYLAYGASVKTFELRVYNRWGEKVFESNNFFEGWNGEYKGVPQPMGVYVYYSSVTLMNNKTQKYKGSLTLIR